MHVSFDPMLMFDSQLRKAVSILAVWLAFASLGFSIERDLRSDEWVATDGLGRALPGYEECGPPRPDRTVGLFYFLWHGEHGTGGPYDIAKILATGANPPPWGPIHAFHHWAEPDLGYYLADDPWVMRRNIQLIGAAGVDVLIVDATNGFTYRDNYTRLFQTLQQLSDAGNPTPRVCFFANATAAQTLLTELYRPNLFSSFWFEWQGKPLLLFANPNPAEQPAQSLKDFFTVRKCWGLSPIDEPDEWSFMQHYPQDAGWHTQGIPEFMSVSIAQQETYMNLPTAHGRSYRNGSQPPPAQQNSLGHNFDEQFRRALTTDPEFVFITGWNEWVAQRFEDANQNTLFVDSYSQEFSRDIEPMKGGHADAYYYQMTALIRQYKGVRAPAPPEPPRAIQVDGSFDDWADATAFYDWAGDGVQRSNRGWGSAGPYLNFTGRNDFVTLKVAHDATNVYFYAETSQPISPHSDRNWMLLFIDADRDHATGWEGYDFLVNGVVAGATTTTLQRNQGGDSWTIDTEIPHATVGNRIELRIPLAALGLAGNDAFSLDFHWADNIQRLNDIDEFANSGDSAPDRRFNYRYRAINPNRAAEWRGFK